MSVSKSGLELAQKLLAARVSWGGFEKLLEKVRITEAGNGSLVAEMTVEIEHCNPKKIMHGAMSSLIVDTLSGIALMTGTKHNFQHAGVSLSINMTYMQAAKLGQEILIKATTDKVGSKIAFLSVDIVNKSSSELLASGYHVKYIANAISPQPHS